MECTYRTEKTNYLKYSLYQQYMNRTINHFETGFKEPTTTTKRLQLPSYIRPSIILSKNLILQVTQRFKSKISCHVSLSNCKMLFLQYMVLMHIFPLTSLIMYVNHYIFTLRPIPKHLFIYLPISLRTLQSELNKKKT